MARLCAATVARRRRYLGLHDERARQIPRAIVGMGERALPLIFQELARSRGHWGWALTAITGASVTTTAQAGDIRAISDAWLRWGRARRYIP